MSCFLTNYQDTTVTISSTNEIDNITYYVINIKIGTITWTIEHRYNDFVELHEKLVSDHGVARDILPPKKVIRNKCPIFIEKRREALEEYLKHILIYLQRTMPKEFATFLDFDVYDILFLLQKLAVKLFQEGDTLLQESKCYTFSPLQVHAISERLKLPCPPLELSERQYDLSHVLDFCCQLEDVTLQGHDSQLASTLGTSNIVPNLLPFEMSSFKSITHLNIIGLSMDNIYHTGSMRDSLTHMKVNYTSAVAVREILLCDVIHKEETSSEHVWTVLTNLDLSCNQISSIDESIKLLPNVDTLNLSRNKISEITTLTQLPKLCNLNLSENLFKICDNWHTKLGNIVSINLSQNLIQSLAGFCKLYSLESLDVSCNNITDIKEIYHIGSLPCLENVRLTGNPVACVIDYRVKVLEQFNARAADICLDNEKPTIQELDTVRVLQALRIVKEGKTPTFTNSDSPLFPGLSN